MLTPDIARACLPTLRTYLVTLSPTSVMLD